MSLAIVIPYYNIHFFDKTLFSLSCQTDKRFKVYIGNNNSPNESNELIDHYKDGLDITYKVFRNDRRSSPTKQSVYAMSLSYIR